MATDGSDSSGAEGVDRRVFVKALSAAGLAGTAGCLGGVSESIGGGQEDVPDSITVWAWDDPALQPVREEQAEEVEEEYGMEVDWEVFPFGDYLPNMTSAVGGNNAPDVGAFSVVWIPEYGHREILADVEEELGIDPDQFVDAARENSTYDGTLVTVPWFHDCRFLGINRGAFEDVGLEVPERTYTPDLEEFENWLAELTEYNDGDPTFVMDSREGFEAFFLSNGGRYLNEDGTECLLNEPEVVEVAEFIQEQILEEETMVVRSPDTATDPIEDFLSGSKQMYYSGLWHHERLEDSDIDWQWNPMPVGPQEEESRTWSAGVYYGVPVAGGANVDGGRVWCEYIISDEVQSRVAEKTGLFPATEAAYETDRFQEFVDDNPNMETAVQEIEQTVPFPSHPEFPAMWEETLRHAERMWFDGDDPQETLDNLAAAIEDLL